MAKQNEKWKSMNSEQNLKQRNWSGKWEYTERMDNIQMVKAGTQLVEDYRASHLSAVENAGHWRRKKHEKEIQVIAYLYGKPYLKKEEKEEERKEIDKLKLILFFYNFRVFHKNIILLKF